MVEIQGGAGGFARDHDLLQARIVRREKLLALAIDAETAGNQVGLVGQHLAVSFDAGDPAAVFQFPQQPRQLRRPGGREFQPPDHTRVRARGHSPRD